MRCFRYGKIEISIHALRGEGDIGDYSDKNGDTKFQSTPSVGRATNYQTDKENLLQHFNPRPPWGGRRSPSGHMRLP